MIAASAAFCRNRRKLITYKLHHAENGQNCTCVYQGRTDTYLHIENCNFSGQSYNVMLNEKFARAMQKYELVSPRSYLTATYSKIQTSEYI